MTASRQADDEITSLRPIIEAIGYALEPGSFRPSSLHPSHAQPRWRFVREKCVRLLGIIDTIGVRSELFTPGGPKLAATGLHPWVWNAATDLWVGNHYMQAVGEAAKRIDVVLGNKLGRLDIFGADLVTQAFTSTAPSSANPRLRFKGIPKGSARWTSAHEGAMQFGRGCMQGIRNWAAHDDEEVEEQQALEYLAALSVLARWIDAAIVVTSEAEEVEVASSE